MKKQSFFLAAFALSVTLFASCSKKDDDQPAPTPPPVTPPANTIVANTYNNLDADVAGKGSFTLFSIAENKIIPNSDSATTKWDIGFRATTIIVNGGTSGPGQAAAQVTTGVYNNLYIAPEAGYATDGPTKAITGWYSYNMDTHLISPVAGKFFVIKTANGKYAKLEVFSYYKDAPSPANPTAPSRYYSFRYVYQADGSRNFK
ncbi:HmuY family protein [Chitinophaga nivalis]|uniref:HmuY family protein n=1 Tax=Chitinophaga nivalis TaxID=2991709 RepID=A0ABT3IGG5_9BACT|nr:HmuY family protein [Chitinophaga nivalis]MCW3467282.1 HmuY family protein [Chitinophaga nivalis]MCW3483026.1 HmuY family protein [Chitinophaga nivalis]